MGIIAKTQKDYLYPGHGQSRKETQTWPARRWHFLWYRKTDWVQEFWMAKKNRKKKLFVGTFRIIIGFSNLIQKKDKLCFSHFSYFLHLCFWAVPQRTEFEKVPWVLHWKCTGALHWCISDVGMLIPGYFIPERNCAFITKTQPFLRVRIHPSLCRCSW